MNEDIVARLRQIATPGTWQDIFTWDAIATEAADQIERLRAEVALWKQVADRFDEYNENNHNDNCGYGSFLTKQDMCYCGRSDYERAVRGE